MPPSPQGGGAGGEGGVWLSLFVGFGEGFLFLPWLFVGLGWVFRFCLGGECQEKCVNGIVNIDSIQDK